MRPVVRVTEMQAIDAEAAEPTDVLIDRAGRAVARAAIDLLGGRYGRRVVVVAGKGNNGNDGRVAAERLARAGVMVTVFDADDAPGHLPAADLVIDAAYGTGITRGVDAPDPGDALVLAVDIPSGVHGDTGTAMGTPMRADVTVTFAAHKPGLLLGDGPALSGEVRVADIGLDVSRATIELVDDDGAAELLPARDRDAHKWEQAVLLVAGSPGMTGAAAMAAGAAQRAGAGMVHIAAPGVGHSFGPVEAVVEPVDEATWAGQLLDGADRYGAVAVGPGLGRAPATQHQVRVLSRDVPVPLVIDGDGLTALGSDVADVVGARTAGTILTPHDGEFGRLYGERPGDDRLGASLALARRTGAVVVLKGPTTVVASPDGRVRLVTAGDERLATAGTGDVLTGTVAAVLAAGLAPFDAAAVAAHLHGTAARWCPSPGTVASDVIDQLPTAWAHVAGAR